MKFYVHKQLACEDFEYKTQSLLGYILPRIDHKEYDAVYVNDYSDIVAETNSWLIVPCTQSSDKHWPAGFMDFIIKNNQLNILLDFSGEPYCDIECQPDPDSDILVSKCLGLLENRSGRVVLFHGSLNKEFFCENTFGMPAQLIHHSIFSKENYRHFYGMENEIISNVFNYATHDFLCLNGRECDIRTDLINRFLDSSQSIIYSLDRSELINWDPHLRWYLNRSLPVEKICDSRIYVATETFTGDHLFITEKTAKAFSMGKPFVIMGSVGIHRQLKDWGFHIFTDGHREDTDDVVNWTFNQAMQIKENYSAPYYLDPCMHNLSLFHSASFQKKLLQEYFLAPLHNISVDK